MKTFAPIGRACEDGSRAVSPDDHRERMARASRLAVLREVVSHLAHDLNQPLGAISASGEAALRWLSRPEPAVDEALASLNRVLLHKDRAAEVVALIRRGLDELPASPTTSVTAAHERAFAALHARGPFKRFDMVRETSAAPALATIGAVEAELLFHHLLRNAFEAGNTEKRRAVEVRCLEDDEHVIIDVSDAGNGVPDAARPFVFDPFFTTKAGAEGLGLSICQSVVRAAGGRIELLASDAKGSTFRVELLRAKVDQVAS